jgi:galactonate dehydratase
MTAGRIESVELRTVVEYGEPIQLVVLRTDTGEHGTGELARAPGWPLAEPSVPALTRLLAGCDPVNQATIAAKAAASGDSTINDPVMIAALTAALADLVGRRLGVPLCRLLGGQVRDHIPVCAVDWAGDAHSPAEFAEAARRIAAAGFATIRLDIDLDPNRPEVSTEVLSAVRHAVPEQVRLVTRAGAAWSTSQILQLLRAAPEPDILWFEPLAAPTAAALRRLAERTPVALAAGRDLRPEALDVLAGAGLVDHLVLNPGTVGGLRRARELAALAEIHHTDVIAVASRGSRSLAVALQLAAAIPNLAAVEARPGQLEVTDGTVPVDLAPGLNDLASPI